MPMNQRSSDLFDPDDELEISQILKEILGFGGIICSGGLHMYLYRGAGDSVERTEIKSLYDYVSYFGSGTYQIELGDPEIKVHKTDPYVIEYFSSQITYKDGKWCDVHVETEFEQIPPSFAIDDETINLPLVRERTNKIAEKIEGAMTILSFFADLMNLISRLSKK
jgi:hypothetical protein